MMSKKARWLWAILVVASLLLAACGSEQPEVVGGFEIPAIEKGSFNVAMVRTSDQLSDARWRPALMTTKPSSLRTMWPILKGPSRLSCERPRR